MRMCNFCGGIGLTNRGRERVEPPLNIYVFIYTAVRATCLRGEKDKPERKRSVFASFSALSSLNRR